MNKKHSDLLKAANEKLKRIKKAENRKKHMMGYIWIEVVVFLSLAMITLVSIQIWRSKYGV